MMRRVRVHLLGPVLVFDLMCTGRRARVFLIRSLYAAAFGAVVAWYAFAWWLVAQASGNGRLRFMGPLTEAFSSLLLGVQFAVGANKRMAWCALAWHAWLGRCP